MNEGWEGSGTEGQASTVADTRAETDVAALIHLEPEFEMQKLRLESEEKIALRKLELGASCGRPESATASGAVGGPDPVSQCAKLLRKQKVPEDAELPVWFDRVEMMFAT